MTRREWLALTGAAGAAGLAGCGRSSTTIHFPASDEEHGNPERGFYVQCAAENPGGLENLRAGGNTLVLLTLDLKHYRDRPLDEARLSVLDEAMNRVREAGLKVVFRAAYGFTDSDYRVDPADLNLIRGHIAALSNRLSSHAPWVFAVQAGMLGPWGEWHGSVHGNPPSLESRLAVVKSWLDGLPDTIFVQVRRPMFLRDLAAATPAVDFKRTGWHDDALLALPDDMGTFAEAGWDRKRELAWCHESLRAVPFGGETVPASEATTPARVLEELKTLHTTFLNRGYHAGTLEKWKQSEVGESNLYQLVARRLGYRLRVTRMDLQRKAGATLQGRLFLRNEGFAAPLKPRNLSFAWHDPVTGKQLAAAESLLTDVSKWRPDAGEIEIPFVMARVDGDAELVPAVRLADASNDLMEIGSHAIRLTGGGLRFEASSGWNILG